MQPRQRLGRRLEREHAAVVEDHAPNHSGEATHPRGDVETKQNDSVRLSAKADYAIRAAVELAAAGEGPTKGERIAAAQEIPPKFLENILQDLKQSGLVQSRRGAEGGYWLARPAAEISLADVIRAVEGPLANVRGARPEDLEYRGAASSLRDVFVAMRANLRAVLEEVTLADVATGALPASVAALTDDPDAWVSH
jgi:Rrf2 family protein